jgi:GAF domain-containing protein
MTTALATIREGFGWAYGSYWAVDTEAQVLRFATESGSAGKEFRDVTLAASFKEGVGLSGRAWRTRDLVFVEDLAQVTDCVRAPAAQRAGVKSGVCLPILVGGEVVGTMDFFATTTLTLAPGREDALRNTAFLLGQALERFAAAERLEQAARQLLESITEVERNVLSATAVADDGKRLTLDANAQVAGLGESSAQIGQVVKVIRGIADQTNLLAPVRPGAGSPSSPTRSRSWPRRRRGPPRTWTPRSPASRSRSSGWSRPWPRSARSSRRSTRRRGSSAAS